MDKKIVIFGNSGSGKSTLALRLGKLHGINHLDLDTVAWLPSTPPVRSPIEDSMLLIRKFTEANRQWVIEGCYTDLLEQVVSECTEVIYMDLPVRLCIENARNRPFEPHKYDSKEKQDGNLPMLIDWITQYETREDTFSQKAHSGLFESFQGSKRRYSDNSQDA